MPFLVFTIRFFFSPLFLNILKQLKKKTSKFTHEHIQVYGICVEVSMRGTVGSAHN